MSYHLTSIPRGTLGQLDKITEEYYEFKDALQQRCAMMATLELSDMLGAILAYAQSTENQNILATHQDLLAAPTVHDIYDDLEWDGEDNSLTGLMHDMHRYLSQYRLSYHDAYIMHTITQRAFQSGARS